MIEMGVEPQRKSVVIEEDEPAHYLVLGDFGGRALEPIAIDRDNFDAVMAKLDVRLAGSPFRELDDFHPDRLYRNLALFREFDQAPAAPDAEAGSAAPAPQADITELLRSASLLEQIVNGHTNGGHTNGGHGNGGDTAGGGDPFDNYVRELARAYAVVPEAADPQREAALTERMCGLLHHPHFQAVEAAWRGLDFAIRAADADYGSRIYIAHYPQAEAERDLNGAASLRGTRALELLNARKWRAVIGLYSFEQHAAHIEFLGRMALLAAHVRAPFLTEGAVDMGGLWEELRSIPEASYLGLALPRVLLRLPYGSHNSPIDAFSFEEMPPGPPVHSHFLWGNPALACLALLSAGDALNLDGLPVHSYQQDGEWKMTPCAEVCLTETQVLALIDLGLMPLVSYKDSDRVRVAGFRAINGEELPLA
jgi:type VI secretion system protein ImpC